MKTVIKTDSRRRLYTILTLLLSIAGSQLTYQGARALGRSKTPTDMTEALDALIPFVPWTVLIYTGTFVFWIAAYIYISRIGREKSDRFFCAQHIAYLVTFFIFLFFPTTAVRPEVTGTTFWDWGIRTVYSSDPPDGLFPSLHCVVSWLCWVGIRGNKKVPLWWRVSSFVIAAAICVSTVTTKQHVIDDVWGGILLSEICYMIAASGKITGIYTRAVDWIMGLFGKKGT